MDGLYNNIAGRLLFCCSAALLDSVPAFTARAGCMSSFTFLQSLGRLQTLELAFQVPCAILHRVPQFVFDHQHCAESLFDVNASHLHEVARFWDTMAGTLKHCSRLRRLVLMSGDKLALVNASCSSSCSVV